MVQGAIGPGDLAHFPERLAAIPELLGRIDHACHQLPASSSRYALIVAATRIALAQASGAVTRDEVRDHARCIHRHLDAHERGTLALGDHALDQAEAWASERVGATYALLVPAQGADDTVEILDAALSHLGSVAIDPRFGSCGPTDPTYAARLGTIAWTRFNDLNAAVYWTSQAADAGNTIAMLILGILLEERGDLVGAEDWFRRGADAGNVSAMGHLGRLLQERGDLTGAKEWYLRVVGPGHGAAMRNLLGDKCRQRGDLAGAEAEWQRAADLGDAGAMYKLGGLLEERGDMAGAKEWYRRAAASEDTSVAAAAVDSLARLGTPRDEDVSEA